MADIKAQGIDVSWANGVIDWSKVQTDFAIIRSGYGWDNDKQIDKQFKANVNGCLANNIPFGIYHYSYAWSVEDARCEARWFLKVIQGLKPEYPVFWDFEEAFQVGAPGKEGFSPSKQMDMIEAWLEIVEHAGYFAALYSSGSVVKRLRDAYPDRMAKYTVWVAHVGVERPMTLGSIWQYSWKGIIPGIAGEVDLNRAYEMYPSIIKAAGLNGWDQVAPMPPLSDSGQSEVKGTYLVYKQMGKFHDPQKATEYAETLSDGVRIDYIPE